MQKYVEISTDIRNKILNGTYKPGERLPFERDLGEQFHASKMTVKRAMDILVQEGLILKKRGSGTYVKNIQPENVNRLNHMNSFLGTSAIHLGKEVTNEVLDFKVILANEKMQEIIKCDSESFVYEFKRLRNVEGKPHVIEHTFMPLDIVPILKKQHLEGSVYDYLKTKIGLNIQTVLREVRARKATSEEAELLKIATGDPVVVMKQTGYLEDGNIFEYTEDVFHSDSFEMQAVFQMKN